MNRLELNAPACVAQGKKCRKMPDGLKEDYFWPFIS